MKKLQSLFTNNGKPDLTTAFTLLALILATLGIDPISLQSWPDVWVLLSATFMNPYKLGLVAYALYGWYRNNQQEEL